MRSSKNQGKRTKIVATSDWHVDASTHGVDRFNELHDAAHRSVDVAIEEDAVAYFFLGDLCDPDCGSRAFRSIKLAIEIAVRLNDAGISSYWLAGNHDVIEDGSGFTTLSPLLPLCGLVSVFERPSVGFIRRGLPSPIRVVALPFCATSHDYDPNVFLQNVALEKVPRERTIVIGHLNVPGVVPGEETLEMPRGRSVTFPSKAATSIGALVFHGHYHRQQRTEEGIWIPGSLARLTFNEEGNRPGFLVAEI